MNYLAHAFLSNNNEELLIGNFIADHLRGNRFDDYSEGIVRGIYLHRSIDAFTDAHAAFKKSKRVFYDGFEKYSGILVDMYFDHLLASRFSDFSPVALSEFSEQTYSIYTAHEHLLPKSSKGFLDYVIKNNVYTSYASAEGIAEVLSHLSHRIGHGVRLDQSLPLFLEHERELSADFTAFFNEAVLTFKR